MSFFSDPAIKKTFTVEPCLQLGSITTRKGLTGKINQENAVTLKCTQLEDDFILQRAGNYSFDRKGDNAVECDQHSLYDFRNVDPVELPLGDIKRQGGSDTDTIIECEIFKDRPTTNGTSDIDTCVALRQAKPTEKNGTLVSFSVALQASEVEAIVQSGILIPFLDTIVKYNTSGLSRQFARRILSAFDKDVTDPQELRKRAFMGLDEGQCAFPNPEDATEVPLGLLYGIIAAWVLSFIAFFCTIFLRRSIFYDMSDPLHWAQRTYRHIDEPIVGNPVVTSVYEHGERLMYVSSSTSNDDDILSRMANMRITWPWRRRRNAANDDNTSDVDVQPQSYFEQPQSV